jgi:NAD(P)-dependent dehydrogenase (short-subunit alcohol dehydrogenase family)
VGMVAQVFHFYAGAVDKHYGETIPVAGGVDMTFREPLGVVGLITPWNFPLNIASWKLGPALACGNTVVLKPAELTPLSSMRLGELALEAGIPEGVVNVVVGKGSVVGTRLIEHPDVADEGSVQAMYRAAAERYGGVDVLYNNAGISPADDDSILETELEAWERVQAVNTRGVFLCCKHGIPHLLERGGGSVINVASFVALVGAATSQISYTASKGAVLSLSKELGVQFARQGVRVNALCPGPVETPLLLRIWSETPGAAERRLVHVPMGRMAKPREIVNAALFLASDESSYVNAATFVVDGGLTAAYVTPE